MVRLLVSVCGMRLVICRLLSREDAVVGRYSESSCRCREDVLLGACCCCFCRLGPSNRRGADSGVLIEEGNVREDCRLSVGFILCLCRSDLGVEAALFDVLNDDELFSKVEFSRAMADFVIEFRCFPPDVFDLLEL